MFSAKDPIGRDELKRLREAVRSANATLEREEFYSKYPLGQDWVANIKNILSPIIDRTGEPRDALDQVLQSIMYISVDQSEGDRKEKLSHTGLNYSDGGG